MRRNQLILRIIFLNLLFILIIYFLKIGLPNVNIKKKSFRIILGVDSYSFHKWTTSSVFISPTFVIMVFFILVDHYIDFSISLKQSIHFLFFGLDKKTGTCCKHIYSTSFFLLIADSFIFEVFNYLLFNFIKKCKIINGNKGLYSWQKKSNVILNFRKDK